MSFSHIPIELRDEAPFNPLKRVAQTSIRSYITATSSWHIFTQHIITSAVKIPVQMRKQCEDEMLNIHRKDKDASGTFWGFIGTNRI